MQPNIIPIYTLYSLGHIQPYYQIEHDDFMTRVRCTKTGRILKATLNPYNGYYYYTMDSIETGGNGLPKRKKIYVHKSNHLAHNENGPYEQVNHIDGNKKNNSPANLHSCTAQENIDHAVENCLIDRNKTIFMITYMDGLQVCGTAMELYDRMGICPKKIHEFCSSEGLDDRYKYNIHSVVVVN